MDQFLDQFLSTQQWQEVGMNRALAGIALDSFSAMELPKLTALAFSHSESEPFHHNRSTLYNTGGTQVQNDEMISHLSYQRMLVDRVNQRVQQGGGQLLVSNSSFNPMGKSIEEEDMPNLLASSSLAFDSSTKFQQSLSSGTLVGPNWHHSFINSSGFPDPIALGQFKSESFPASTEVLGKRSRQEDDDEEDEADQDMMNQSQSQSQGQGQGQIQTTTSVDVVPKPRLRARRGQATDPHSIAERNRRERISERLKALQVLVPDANKTDKASMLDEIIGYVRFLQMQVKCLSVCRLGGSGMAASLIADLPVDGGDNPLTKGCNMPKSNGSSQDAMEYAEWQVARLMDEDMSAAMQYLQNKGLCLMPISLATAISTTTTTATAKHRLFSHLSHESLESCTGQEPPLHAIPTPINMPKEDAN